MIDYRENKQIYIYKWSTLGKKIYITSNHVCVLDIIFIIIIIIKYFGMITFNKNIFRYTSKIECNSAQL